MSAMHDDKWIADTDQPTPKKLREVLAARDKRAAETGTVNAHWEDLVRQRVAAAERDPAITTQPGHWAPDEFETRARAVIDYRDRIANSVPDPVPPVGTPEWEAADWRTKTAAYARHERDVSAAQGPRISNRMAAESGWRRDLVESSGAISEEWMRLGYGGQVAPGQFRQLRDIPEQRQPEWIPAQAGDAGAARVRGR